MASEADIEAVKDLMPGSDEDWDDQKIGIYLDAGRSIAKVMQLFWESRASKLHTMIDISESGSSRSLSRLYDNAMKLAEYWDAKVAKEEEKAEEEEKDEDRRLSFNTITRV